MPSAIHFLCDYTIVVLPSNDFLLRYSSDAFNVFHILYSKLNISSSPESIDKVKTFLILGKLSPGRRFLRKHVHSRMT